MDRDADGKITIYDLEELALRNLGSNEKKQTQNKKSLPKPYEKHEINKPSLKKRKIKKTTN